MLFSFFCEIWKEIIDRMSELLSMQGGFESSRLKIISKWWLKFQSVSHTKLSYSFRLGLDLKWIHQMDYFYDSLWCFMGYSEEVVYAIAYFSCLLISTVQNCDVKWKSKDNVEECICIHFWMKTHCLDYRVLLIQWDHLLSACWSPLGSTKTSIVHSTCVTFLSQNTICLSSWWWKWISWSDPLWYGAHKSLESHNTLLSLHLWTYFLKLKLNYTKTQAERLSTHRNMLISFFLLFAHPIKLISNVDASIQNDNVLPLKLNYIYSMVNLLSKHQIHHVSPQILYLEILCFNHGCWSESLKLHNALW